MRTFAHPDDLFQAAEQRLPDIVLLDMQMGPFKGAQVAEQLLQRWPNLCIIVVTGYPSLEDMRTTFKMKVFDYLAKPFSLAQLRQTLQNAAETFGWGERRTTGCASGSAIASRCCASSATGRSKIWPPQRALSVSQISSIERGANLPEHGVPAGDLPGVREEALRDPGLDRLLSPVCCFLSSTPRPKRPHERM